jgi:hypothetical protein
MITQPFTAQANDLVPAFAEKAFGLDVVKLDYKITGAPANRQIDGLFLDAKSETFIIVESKLSMSLSAYVSVNNFQILHIRSCCSSIL